ncbi:MAG: Spy/CpxP family protein refolding chaperone [Desulfuromonadaceae bacterium]
MKKHLSMVSLLSVLLLAVATFSVQAGPYGGGRGACGDCPNGAKGGFLQRMTQVLDLSEVQQAQIKDILAEERTRVEPLRRQMAENRKQLQQVMRSETFDEGAVRELAKQKAQVSEELMVSKARARHLIQAQLTPEQREKAVDLLTMRHGRHGHRARCQADRSAVAQP